MYTIVTYVMCCGVCFKILSLERIHTSINMPLLLVAHHMVIGSKIVYCRRVKGIIPKMINNDTLDMLMSREQLMEDIIAIVDGELSGIISQELSDELERRLCDAVCRNFPAK